MTSTQIEYAKLLENMRANRASEDNARMRLNNDYAVATMNLGETIRHNQAQEALGAGQLEESQRSNRAREGETYRTDLVREGLEATSVAWEAERARETQRHDEAMEALNAKELAIKGAQAAEAHRHNVESEALSAQSISTDLLGLAVQRERNAQTYTLGLYGVMTDVVHEGESIRHNLATEDISSNQLAEAGRHNLTSENLEERKVTVSEREQDRRQEQMIHDIGIDISQEIRHWVEFVLPDERSNNEQNRKR